MKILHVVPDLAPETGGPVVEVLGMATAQAAIGHRVAIAASNFGVRQAPDLDAISLHLFRCQFSPWRWTPELGRFLRREAKSYDIVHLHTIWQYPTWAAGLACGRARIPYVVSTCGMLAPWALAQKAWKKRPYLWFIERDTLRRAAALHYTAEGDRASSDAESWNHGHFVLPLGIPRSAYIDLPAPASFAKRFPATAGRRIVVFLGRLHYKKQPDVAVRAFHEACRDAPDTCLVLAGPSSPDYLRYLQRLANDLRIEDRVIFTGILRGPAVQEAYRSAALFVLPSLQENFGIAVAEAMAAGCPVVVSDQVDLSPDIRQAEAGLVATPTVEAVAGAVALLLRDEPLRRRMGENGRRLVLERFTWEKVAPDFVQVYEDILSGRRLSPAWRIPDRVWEAGPDSSDN